MQVIRFTSPPFGILTPHKLSIHWNDAATHKVIGTPASNRAMRKPHPRFNA